MNLLHDKPCLQCNITITYIFLQVLHMFDMTRDTSSEKSHVIKRT